MKCALQHKVATLLFCGAFLFGQGTSPPGEPKTEPRASSSDQQQKLRSVESRNPCASVQASAMEQAARVAGDHSGDYGIGTAKKADHLDTSPTAHSSKSTITVGISPQPSLQVPVGGSEVVTATVAGTSNTAVNWSVAGLGCSGSACGAMSGGLYLAPNTLPTPPWVMVTATSEADPSASASITVCIVQRDFGRSPLAFGNPLSAAQPITQAARAAAASRKPLPTPLTAPLEVLSDTMGVDFSLYLQSVLKDIKKNWNHLIPASARAPEMKRGKVSIEFSILKDGRVAGMKLAQSSGDVELDRGAWGGIVASNPFPPLPSEFGGQYLAVRLAFQYNPDRNDSSAGPTSESSKSGIAISISPTNQVEVVAGSRQPFSATVMGTTNTAVMWSVDGLGCSGTACGTMDRFAGLYTAPIVVPNPPWVTVRAYLRTDPSAWASAKVLIVYRGLSH